MKEIGDERMKLPMTRKDRIISKLIAENMDLKSRNKALVDLCNIKDEHFKLVIADALRHGSKTAAKYMADRKNYLKGN